MKRQDAQRVSFAVPAGSGDYAPERITFGVISASQSKAETNILGVTAFVESAPAGASLELWLPKVTANMATTPDADFFFFANVVTGIAGGATIALAAVLGAQLRMKSGGAAAAAVVNGFAY